MKFLKSLPYIVILLTLGLSNSFDVHYESDEDIAGFQFSVTGATITDASGGAAEEADRGQRALSRR